MSDNDPPHSGNHALDWHELCPLQALNPIGRGAFLSVHGREFAVFALPGGRYAVTDNACPHAGGNLAAGAVRDGVVECPWHHWRFDLATGACVAESRVTVRTYACEVRDAALWVRLP